MGYLMACMGISIQASQLLVIPPHPRRTSCNPSGLGLSRTISVDFVFLDSTFSAFLENSTVDTRFSSRLS
ncbi:hypothetical protein PoB_003799300 [Plakobranchus ocellatus]|uniref:Secreted protein n=1 Tax=Plakobranchus ocellatus TaxID=259542 RepID=A0AAV4AYC9_9GAST|nr:hypothetical protein PoB_003799300 [Plakobranchus ocellatus]